MPHSIPDLIAAYESGSIPASRLAWAIGEAGQNDPVPIGIAFLAGDRIYAVGREGGLIVRRMVRA